MERLAIFVNDAIYAQRFLQPLLAQRDAVEPCTMVLCPPRLSHRVGKWLSNRQRQQWQRTWADRLQQDLRTQLPAGLADRLDWLVAPGRVADTTVQLRRRQGTSLQVLDIRKPHVGQSLPAIEPGQPSTGEDRWKAPVAVSSSLAVVLALVD